MDDAERAAAVREMLDIWYELATAAKLAIEEQAEHDGLSDETRQRVEHAMALAEEWVLPQD